MSKSITTRALLFCVAVTLAPIPSLADSHESYLCRVEQMAGYEWEDGGWRVAALDKRNDYMVRPLSAKDRGASSDVRGLRPESTHVIEVISDPIVPLRYACETTGTLIVCTTGKFVLSLKTLKFEYAHLGLAPIPDDVLAMMPTPPRPGLQWGRCDRL